MTVSFPPGTLLALSFFFFLPSLWGSFPSAGEVRHAEPWPHSNVPGEAWQPLSASNLKFCEDGEMGTLATWSFTKPELHAGCQAMLSTD